MLYYVVCKYANEAAEAQEGSPAYDGTPEWTRSPGVVLTDSVMHLQREIKELRSDSLYFPETCKMVCLE